MNQTFDIDLLEYMWEQLAPDWATFLATNADGAWCWYDSFPHENHLGRCCEVTAPSTITMNTISTLDKAVYVKPHLTMVKQGGGISATRRYPHLELHEVRCTGYAYPAINGQTCKHRRRCLRHVALSRLDRLDGIVDYSDIQVQHATNTCRNYLPASESLL